MAFNSAPGSRPWRREAPPRKFVTRKFARMQYRQDETAPWADVGDAWADRPEGDGDGEHPEPWNVQKVTLGVRQYHKRYHSQFNRNQIKAVQEAHYGWKVHFPLQMISGIHLEEFDVDSWVPNASEGAKRTFWVVRFRCTGQPTGSDASELPRDTVHPSAAAEDEEMDTAGEEHAEELDPKKPSKYPLAMLCADLQGKYIRLAFDKGVATGETSATKWIWPMIVHVLAGIPWYSNKADIDAPLNAWARAHKDRLGSVVLKEVTSGDRVEWSVERAQGHSESSIPPGWFSPGPPGPIPYDYVFGQPPPPAQDPYGFQSEPLGQPPQRGYPVQPAYGFQSELPESPSRPESPAPRHARRAIQYRAPPIPAGPPAFDSLPQRPAGRPREELLEDLRAQRVRAQSHVAAMVRERRNAEQALQDARERQTEAEREMANVERQLQDLGEGRAVRPRF
ncbi:MAG: hypothetical protein Q9193_000351 [Seirophora villosa]